ncbi:MAG: DUF1508 domain-containing protein [Candidatus Thermoplasmatota archaeon]
MALEYEETLYSKTLPVCKEPQKRKPKKTGKFELFQDKTGGFRFRLKASNGEVIAVSQRYRSKKSCLNGIQSVKKNTMNAEIAHLKDKR